MNYDRGSSTIHHLIVHACDASELEGDETASGSSSKDDNVLGHAANRG